MANGCQIRKQDETYFITLTVVNWIDVFTRRMYRDIVVENLRYCQKNKGLEIFAFVIMTNHIHLIVIMDNTDDQRLPRCDSPTNPDDDGNPEDWVVGLPYYDSRTDKDPEINEEMQRRANCCGRLSHIIGQFKSAVTKYANQREIPFMWQPRFHDHIIRNGVEMNRIADYIQNNPMKWELDRFYKKR